MSDCLASRLSLSSYSLPCEAGAVFAARNQRQNRKRKNKNMTANQGQTNSSDRGSMKSTQPATANLASPKAARQEATGPSNADIAAKAYEIWLSRGQEMGNDQQHWFEAKRQLRHM